MTDKKNTFGEAIAPLIRKGYPASDLLPIIPPDARLDAQTRVAPENRGKNPGRYAPGRDLETGQGTWGGLKGWVNGLRKEDRDPASGWPTANVGLLAARFPGLDVDVNSEDARELVMRVAESSLPGIGPVRLRAGSPRCLVPFRLNGEPFGKMRLSFSDSSGINHAVEILGSGNQYLIAGMHPSGSRYEWTNGGLTACAPDNLPCMSREGAEAFLSLLEEEIEKRGWSIVARSGSGQSMGGKRTPLDDIVPPYPPEVAFAALRHMPNTTQNFPTYPDLVVVTSELKAALGRNAEAHLADYLEWAGAGDFPETNFEGLWDSIREVSKNPLALYWRARAHGFRGDAVEDFRKEVSTTSAATNVPTNEGPGRIRTTNLDTIAQKLAEAPEWQGVFGYDEFAKTEAVLKHLPDPDRRNHIPNEPISPRALLDGDITQTQLWLQRHGGMPTAKESDVRRAIGWRAATNKFHPAREWVASLEWDGEQRLNTWLVDHLGADADVPPELKELYLTEVGRRFLIGAVARIYEPGAKLDTVLVLEGEQGIGKSTVVRALVPNSEWHSDTLPDMDHKDAALHLRGKLVVELSELAGVGRTGVEHVKSFISTSVDKVRPHYGGRDESYPRQCIFVGTTNASEYLRDDSGGRRFLPVRMTKTLDLAAFLSVRDQLWAEAKVAYQNGEPWYLTGEALDAAKHAQGAKAETDPWDEDVLAKAREMAAAGKRPPTAANLLREGVGLLPQFQSRAHQNRLGGSLRRAGWRSDRQRINGRNVRFWWHDEYGNPPLQRWEEEERKSLEAWNG